MINVRLFLSGLAWAVLGAVIGNLTAEPMARGRDAVLQGLCGLEENLAHGRRYRREALILKRTARSSSGAETDVVRLHKAANSAFEKARDCGSAQALAHLGTAHCHGWGVERNRNKGMALIHEAAGMNVAVAIEWLREDSYCPVTDQIASSHSPSGRE